MNNKMNSTLALGNASMRAGNYEDALGHYASVLVNTPALGKNILANIAIAKKKYRRNRDGVAKQRVGVCSWELAHNPAGRAYTLASMYATFADVELIGSIFPQFGHDVWQPIRHTAIAKHSFVVEDESRFFEQAIDLVASHPYDVVHLSKPRMPNLFIGMLYKLLWDAKVVVDIDDEELAFVDAEKAIALDEYLGKHHQLPALVNLAGKEWTRLAVGKAEMFDGVTVSNHMLKQRYGGVIVPHGRDEAQFKPSAELKRQSRDKYGVPQEKKVVLFFGTPREHKGLVETAEAISSLNRDDVLFVVAGDFPNGDLKDSLMHKLGKQCLFIGNQPIEMAPEIVALGDVCVLLQDPRALVSRFQMPAKLTDALAMGLAVLAENTPVLQTLIKADVISQTDAAHLSEHLGTLLSQPARLGELGEAGRSTFLKSMTTRHGGAVLCEFLKNIESKPFEEQYAQILSHSFECWKEMFGRDVGVNMLFEGKQQRQSNVRRLARSDQGEALNVNNSGRLAGVFPELVQASTFCEVLQSIVSSKLPSGLAEKLSASELALSQAASRFSVLDANVPLVSVVMPTFNRAEIILKAIASVRDQSYRNWELLVCDDGSTDNSEQIVRGLNDSRIRYLKLTQNGAAAARNAGLRIARGSIITYLDSDNVWHPHYVARVVAALDDESGKSSCYANYIDYKVMRDGTKSIKSIGSPDFNHEKLLEKNFIDLNSFAHRRELYDLFGGFNENLTRRQDYDLIIKYTWLRDPIKIDEIVALYQRNESLDQITTSMKHDMSCVSIIEGNIERYLKAGLPCKPVPGVKRVTVISWDLCRNHFSKPFAVAEALSTVYDVKLISFRFFEEEIFPPLQGVKAPFETVYFQGASFPEFFDTMRKAIEEIDGDVVYVVKPRLPSLGLALLANAVRGTPVVLEINDLETVVASPKAKDRHGEAVLDLEQIKLKELESPYSDEWSRIMDPIAKELPVLVTHNQGLDAHFSDRCLYMRNLKDESVYDPDNYDRNSIRQELGFCEDDRVILFGGLLRKHKGIYELVNLIERLGDPRYKLLFVGSRVTPDQRKLVETFGDQIRVLPPQDREAMARINLAADLVILWLNPDVPASHYQMPYKATDAFAMGAHIIANDISDLGILHRQGYLTHVPFGDWDGMLQAIHSIFNSPDDAARVRAAARRLFLRQFSYAAARSSFALSANRAVAKPNHVLPTAADFAKRFDAFYKKTTEKTDAFIDLRPSAVNLRQASTTASVSHGQSIRILDVAQLDSFHLSDPTGVAVVMPAIDIAKAFEAAELLLRRAGMQTTILIAEDTLRQGFIPTLNSVAAKLDVRYVVYLAEDAFPGLDWLKYAYDRLEETGKSLLAFNCGKWRGRIAAFGMVRMSWVKKTYGGAVLYPGYKAHKADNEITVIARLANEYIYEPDATLVEIDARKTGMNKESAPTAAADRKLFTRRFRDGFDGLFAREEMLTLEDEYLNRRNVAKVATNEVALN